MSPLTILNSFQIWKKYWEIFLKNPNLGNFLGVVDVPCRRRRKTSLLSTYLEVLGVGPPGGSPSPPLSRRPWQNKSQLQRWPVKHPGE